MSTIWPNPNLWPEYLRFFTVVLRCLNHAFWEAFCIQIFVMEPKVGIEPTAYALPRRCSTSELLGLETASLDQRRAEPPFDTATATGTIVRAQVRPVVFILNR